ncbi:unnamed protein product [Strongylus vulgaris]|uniref:Uncharacterized protein n=1 Tax=Strongylus vulgaris TaxID=40348 RepID=A0A3P7J8U0_STRVU|nr:unnamed protein product [Strongylus vulgaris]
MIYSQAFRNEQFSPAVALFSAAGSAPHSVSFILVNFLSQQ